MIVDIHTHQSSISAFPAIRNIEFSASETILLSSETGFFSIGIHPWYASEVSTNSFANLEKWANDKRVVAIGECGLDKNSKSSFVQQLFVFKEQVELSEKIRKPMIIHCVGYFNELFELKKEIQPLQKWIIHGFRGKPELAKQAIKAGCSLSFGEHYNDESVLQTPIDKLFVETDESTLKIVELCKRLTEIKLCTLMDLNAGSKLIQSHKLKFNY